MHRGNRHGRSEQARLSVLEAADDLLAEKGFAQLTIEGIAQRAGVAKQTIYRWWSSKTEILLDAFLTDAVEDLNPRGAADVAADLRRLAWFLTRSDAGAVFRALMAEAQHDPALAGRLRTEYLDKQKERAGFTDGALFDRLVGPIYYRALVTGEEITDQFIDDLVTATLPPSSRV
ncbi:TetR/AcrR family transcriptional regulator [Actinoplanes sp. NPDC051411]|uniref:TetR/AcrR family transcriptional regulator n=1 Tax=Actinoplanes sp. NPDC051411 TaxID=3155522 RepID=UPI00342CB87F